MQFVLMVSSYCAPDDVGVFSGAQSAYCFAKNAQENHTVRQIFFSQQGVFNAYLDAKFVIPWTTLGVPLHVCQTAVLEQGLVSENIRTGFVLSSLTQFFAVLLKTDRYIFF